MEILMVQFPYSSYEYPLSVFRRGKHSRRRAAPGELEYRRRLDGDRFRPQGMEQLQHVLGNIDLDEAVGFINDEEVGPVPGDLVTGLKRPADRPASAS